MNNRLALILFVSCTFLAASLAGQQDSAGSAPAKSASDLAIVVKSLNRNHYFWPTRGIVPPKPLTTELPPYTETAPPGKTVLAIGIGATGRVEQIQLVKSLTKDFDEYAIKTVSHWTFAPATKDGTPVPVYLNVDFDSKKVNRETGASH